MVEIAQGNNFALGMYVFDIICINEEYEQTNQHSNATFTVHMCIYVIP